MTEDDALEVVRRSTDDEALARLDRLRELVLAENATQNLIARSTEPSIWTRHILDSIQLLRFAQDRPGVWVDIGTGGGFPGLAIAAAELDRQVILVEPRKLRADFLNRAARHLRLDNVRVEQRRIEAVTTTAEVISARAVAPIEKLLHAARHCATSSTRWLLLRGGVDSSEIARRAMFHVEQSLTHPGSVIAIGEGIPR